MVKFSKLIFIGCTIAVSIQAADFEPKKGCLTRFKAAFMLGVVGVSKATGNPVPHHQQYINPTDYIYFPGNSSTTPSADSLFSCSLTPDKASLSQALVALPSVRSLESYDQKESRINHEQQLSTLLADTPMDQEDPCNSFVHEHLHAKGYQHIDGQLASRYTVQKQRYPEAFGTFLARTNEKQLSHQIISSFMNDLYAVHPAYFNKGLRVFDIGCGNGQFSQSLVKSFSTTFPGGITNMTFSGTDTQEGFIESTNRLVGELGMAKPSAFVGNFRDDAVAKESMNSANLVVASHFAYVFPDMDQFIEKVEAILQKDGVAIFLHGGDTPIDRFRARFTNILRPAAATGNTPEKLDKAIKKAGLYVQSYDFQPILKFPELSLREWKALRSVESYNYTADYSHWNKQLIDAKRLIEFFLQDPLEAFTQEQRNQLVNEFRNMMVANDHTIPLSNTMHVVTARDSKADLKSAIKKVIQSRKR